MTVHTVLLASLAMAFLSSCSNPTPVTSINKQHFGTSGNNKPVALYTFKNSQGVTAKVTNFGGVLTSLMVPDKTGKLDDVVAGFDSLEEYIEAKRYFGAITGRYAGRIANGKFSIDGMPYTLVQNNGGNNLHGGLKGFDKVVWDAEIIQSPYPSLKLSYLSKDGEEGFPGNIKATAIYTLTEDNALTIEYSATTDKKTVINLSHHAYFNLSGFDGLDIYDHEVTINADKFTPINSASVPTGEFRPVKNTPLDFIKPRKIGERIDSKDEQIILGHGYDHNWVINRSGNGIQLMAMVNEPTTGRVMEVYSDKPGLQFYTANFWDGKNIGRNGKPYKRRHAFCMEPQNHPDSPNKPHFPSTILSPGETYKHTIIYKFSIL